MQIRTRLAIQFSMMVAAVLLAFTLLIYGLSAGNRRNDFKNRMKEQAINTAKLLIDVKEVSPDILRAIDSAKYTSLLNEEIVVYDFFKRSQIYKSTDSLNIIVDEALLTKIMNAEEYYFRQNRREALGILYTNGLRRFIVITSAVDEYGIRRINNLGLVLLLGLFLAIGFTILNSLIFARQALKPMSRVIQEVSNITAQNLSARVDEGNGEDEIARLAITFNKMLSRLEKAFNIQTSFVSNASHELRTPLATITSQIEVAMMKPREAEEYRQVLKSVLEETRALTALSNNLLEIAKSEQDISSMKIGEVRLDELLLNAQSELLAKYPEKKLEIDFEDRTRIDHELSIEGNENLLKLVFLNLIDNALKFSGDKAVLAKLIFFDDAVKFRVIDQGIGISKEDVKHIFEPFYRAPNSKNTYGHGIGMSLVIKIIQLHHGEIAIDSELNSGTTVTVTFQYKLH